MHNTVDTLKEIQQKFAHAINGGKIDYKFIKSDLAEERINIYKNNMQTILVNALSSTFSGSKKLLGEECFKACVKRFCENKENLPHNGCLDYWGGKFPDFLQSLQELSSLPYIRDYAWYEWLKSQSYMLIEKLSITHEELSLIGEADSENISLELQEYLILFESKYPINLIDDIALGKNQNDIKLKESESFCAITKQSCIWISKALYTFIRNLRNHSISLSYKNTLMIDSEFDLSQALLFLLKNKLITHIKKENIYV